MPSEVECKKFFSVTVKLSMLSEEQATVLEQEAISTNRTPEEILSEKALLTPVQIDIVHTLLSPLKIVPGYEVQDVIGLGGMGVIYRAKQIALNREVALKTILLSQIGASNVVRRFQQEAQAVARLQHPHIVTAYDFGEQDGRFFFSMELVEGINADQHLKKQGPLEESLVLAIALQIISGLAHASEHQITHRDIKPANLLLSKAPKSYPLPPDVPLVKIADFGLAFLAEQAEDRTRLTSHDAAIGSPHYLAPEQLEDDTVDHRADVYGLGATLYHLLAGQPPFQGKNLNQILSQKLSGKYIPIRELNPLVSVETQTFIENMLITDPHKRTTDYAALWEHCSSLLQKKTTNANLTNTISIHSPTVNQNTRDSSFDQTVLVDSATKPRLSQKSALRKIVSRSLFVLCLGLLVWGGYIEFQQMNSNVNPQLVPSQSIPIFNGADLKGWTTVNGNVQKSSSDESGLFILVGQDSTTKTNLCSRLLDQSSPQADCLKHYEVGLAFELKEADAVLISFAKTETGEQWGVRISKQEAALIQHTENLEAVIATKPFVSVAMSQVRTDASKYLVLFRDKEYWFVYLNQRQIAKVPLSETDQQAESELFLSAIGGPAQFHDLHVSPLVEPQSSGGIKVDSE